MVPEIVEGSKASLKIVGIDGDIIVAVFAGLSPNERHDTPTAANPVTHSHFIQGIENLDDFGKEHAGRLEPGRAHHCRISAHQHLARTAAWAEVATGQFRRHDRRMTAQPFLRSVDAVTVPVPDLDAGLSFYRDRLGHSLLWRHGEIGQAGLQLAASDTELVLTTRGAYAPSWLVSSADDAVAAVVHAGGHRISGPSDVPVGRLAVVADVFGNELVLLDLSKGTYVVDESGHVTGVR